MSDTKRRDFMTGKKIKNDGKQGKTILGEAHLDEKAGDKIRMDYLGSDYRSVDCPEEKRVLKKVIRRAIRRTGKASIKNEMNEA